MAGGGHTRSHHRAHEVGGGWGDCEPGTHSELAGEVATGGKPAERGVPACCLFQQEPPSGPRASFWPKKTVPR